MHGCPLHRKDMDPTKDENLPQTNDSDTGQWDDQYRDSKGQDGVSQRSVRDQNMDKNTDDSRDMSEWGEKKCSDTRGGPILVEEEQWIVVRSNRATISMDTEADNANVPKNEDSDLQLGLGEDEGAPERGLSNMDRDRTRENGSEMETALSRDLDIPSRDRYLQTGVDPMQGKETGGRPDDEASEVNTTTDSAQKLGDRHTEPSNVERRRKSNDVGQGVQQTAPVDIANNIVEKNYVRKTLALLSPPQFGQFTNRMDDALVGWSGEWEVRAEPLTPAIQSTLALMLLRKHILVLQDDIGRRVLV